MPNHFHGIIEIREEIGTARPSLSEIVAFFKYQSAKRVNLERQTPGKPFWQRNYYEHVIRDDEDFDRIWNYVVNNVLTWEKDSLFEK